jgi:putative MFS transporter
MGTAIGTAWLRLASMIGPFLVGQTIGHGVGPTFLVFGVTALVGVVVVAFCAIETKGRRLEEISP